MAELLLYRGLHAREDKHRIRQSLSFDLDRSNGRIKLSDLAGSKLNPIRTAVIDHVLHHGRAGYRDNPGFLGHQPCKGDLGRSDLLTRSPSLYQLNELEVL